MMASRVLSPVLGRRLMMRPMSVGDGWTKWVHEHFNAPSLAASSRNFHFASPQLHPAPDRALTRSVSKRLTGSVPTEPIADTTPDSTAGPFPVPSVEGLPP